MPMEMAVLAAEAFEIEAAELIRRETERMLENELARRAKNAERMQRKRERDVAQRDATCAHVAQPPPSPSPPLKTTQPNLPTPSLDQTPPLPLTPSPPAKIRSVATRRCPADFEPDASVYQVAEKNGLTPDDMRREIETLRDHQFRDAHTDWQAVARNWLRRARPPPRRGGQQQLSFAVQDAMLAEAEHRDLLNFIGEKYGGPTGDSGRNSGVVVALPAPKTLSR